MADYLLTDKEEINILHLYKIQEGERSKTIQSGVNPTVKLSKKEVNCLNITVN
jgi:hypothetical protein